MTWQAPEYLAGLALLVPLAALALWRARLRFQAWKQLGRDEPDVGHAWMLPVLAGLVLVLALARPTGTAASVARTVEARDVVLLLDVSRSMGADDANPSRLDVAKLLARGLLETRDNPHDRVGVVAFAGRAVVRCPLTENLGAVQDVVDRLKPGSVQPGGTDLSAALALALQLFDEQVDAQGQSLVLISDGEDHPNAWKTALAACEARHVVVHALAVGDSDEGAPVPGESPIVITKRVDAPLRAIAEGTGGAFVPIGTSVVNAAGLFRDVLDPGAVRARRLMGWTERVELYPWLIAPLLIGVAFQGTRWLWRRPRRSILSWGILAVATLITGAAGMGDQGRDLFLAGDFDRARAFYERERAKNPDNHVLAYNLGESYFALNRFDDARDAYLAARRTPDPILRAKCDYALGNCLTAQGRLKDAIGAYDACIAALAHQAGEKSLLNDANVNREFVQALLEKRQSKPGAPGTNRPDRAQQNASEPNRDSGSTNPEGSQNTPSRSSDPGEGNNAESETIEPPENLPPQERLSRAMRNIEDAKAGRLPTPDAPPATTGMPDW